MGNQQPKTVAISLLVHGEAVRFNRGKSRGDEFDFKYMRGWDGHKYPYVSSQCFKRYWREALPGEPSPIIRQPNAKGEEKNQAYTMGNPIRYVDDDLFGYMIAGAESDSVEETDSGEEGDVEGVEQVDELMKSLLFKAEDLKSTKGLLARIKDTSDELAGYLRDQLTEEDRERFEAADPNEEPSDPVIQAMLNVLNQAMRDMDLYTEERFPKLRGAKKPKGKETATEIMSLNRASLQKAFRKEIEQEQKPATRRRTAPVRMHALVAFSNIKTASDFQTFSRDVALTGKNSILNPNPVGIYSGWLKARILVEAHRIGKFYIGPNRDILDDLVAGHEKQEEIDPYSRSGEKVYSVQLDEGERRRRLQNIIEALANVGNQQGPASGALHDGSLRPKGFIAAVMNCADSPFDSVWRGTAELPHLDLKRLELVLEDWSDLFASPRIYVGLPIEFAEEDEGFRQNVEEAIRNAGFDPVVGTPRKMLLQLAQEAPEAAVPETQEQVL